MVFGDAFLWLAKREPASIHAVVTDPPYGVIEYDLAQLEKRGKRGGVWRLPKKFDGANRMALPRFTVIKDKGLKRITEFHTRFAPLLWHVLVPGAHVFVAAQPLFTHIIASAFFNTGFEVRGQIVRLVKTFRGGDKPKFGHDEYPGVSVIPRSGWEPWLLFRKPCEGSVKDNLAKWSTGALRRPSLGTPFWDVIPSSPTSKKERAIASHPSLKPQAFIRVIVHAALPLGKGMILDPFAGAGSTIAAAEHLGLHSIGIEINRDYYKTASKAIPKLALYIPNGRESPE